MVETVKTFQEQITDAFARIKKSTQLLRVEPVKNRQERLGKLRKWIHANRSNIHAAMHADFNKAPVEVDAIEIFHVLSEIKTAAENLGSWTRPKKIDAPFTMIGTRSHIQYEPKGACLIISPWNYPFSLSIGPLVSAIAAGNSVIIKPSEMTPNVSGLIRKMVDEIFDRNVITVVEGGPEVAKFLLTLPFDHIFYTGSPAIGKLVMKAAAENLSSVTLELGGKSPVIVTASANIKDAAQRIAVAKFVNKGQTCIAPDYVLVDDSIAADLTSAIIGQTKKMFAEDGNFATSKSYCRIVNEKHFDRLNELLQDALNAGAKLEMSGPVNRNDRFIHPMILSSVSLSAKIMHDEIFGPILPIVPFKSVDEAIQVIHEKPKPLALYIFARNRKTQNKILAETSAGAVCINDCGIHFLHGNLPFGGVNNSGIGKSHGHYGFLAFSNEKPVLRQKSGFTSVRAFYPPYTTSSRRLMEWFLKLF